MKKERKLSYSLGFKEEVVQEYENGMYSYEMLRRKYGIRGKSTIARWVKELGRNKYIDKEVVVMTSSELKQIKSLREKVAQLEKMLAKETCGKYAYQSIVEVIEEEYGPEIKKKCLEKPSKEARSIINNP